MSSSSSLSSLLSSASASASGRWYVESDLGWIPVADDYSTAVEGAYQRGDAVVRVADAGRPFTYTVRIASAASAAGGATQTNDATGRTRALRRLPVTDYVWQFLDTSMSSSLSAVVPWKTYPNSELLESEFAASAAGRAAAELITMSASGQPVHIDMVRLVEQNCATGASRAVRRIRREDALSSSPSSSGTSDPDSIVWRTLSVGDGDGGLGGDQCPICHDPMDLTVGGEAVVELRGCKGHVFHKECIRPVLKPGGSLKCPMCSKISGTPHTGNQPPGTMTARTVNSGRHGVRGLEGCAAIVISYALPSGTQGDEHPSPGAPFCGTQRTAYLPDTSEGREVLRLLQIAWERRLIFTVGTSVTTGQANCAIWSGIHHKTSTGGGPYGYPDETYLARVKDELQAKGVS